MVYATKQKSIIKLFWLGIILLGPWLPYMIMKSIHKLDGTSQTALPFLLIAFSAATLAVVAAVQLQKIIRPRAKILAIAGYANIAAAVLFSSAFLVLSALRYQHALQAGGSIKNVPISYLTLSIVTAHLCYGLSSLTIIRKSHSRGNDHVTR